MSNKNDSEAPLIRIRRRDTAAVAGLGSMVLVLFWMFGELGLLETVVAITTIAALSTFYYLTVRTALNPLPDPASHRGQDSGASGSSANAQLMLESLPIPVLLVGSGGRIEIANPAAREFLGLGPVTGHLSSVLRQPQVLEAVSAALRGHAVEPVEYSMMAPVESHVRAFVAPVAAPEDPALPWRAMLVLSDETSIKRADRMRADFLANASHELRTPLASLAGFIETLRGHAKDDPDARDRFLAIMFDQTERMQRLINDLLSLSRVEMDEHVPPSGTADMAAIIDDVVDVLRPQIAEKSIRLEVNAEPAVAVGERDQLLEVVMNLVENAIKYSESGSTVTLQLCTGLTRDQAERPGLVLGDAASRLTLAGPSSEAGDRFLAVRVRDAGKGIERGNLPRLSERFYRVDGQKSGPKEGTGLGLAIVKHIVNRHRGGFTVESLPGTGSVFSVFLPVARHVSKASELPGG
ncbi:ATP-binding protein [Maricaulis sp.]|uniref:ATP-binding protein n=1 Tax=Maricaulis sp. TaxID=1486257 RepID=UPI0025BA9449|nr:ATP-binding protein [Maricaulis sp.]